MVEKDRRTQEPRDELRETAEREKAQNYDQAFRSSYHSTGAEVLERVLRLGSH